MGDPPCETEKINTFLDYITGDSGKQPFSPGSREDRQKIFSSFLFTKTEKTAIIA
jgi:hypothetical protein